MHDRPKVESFKVETPVGSFESDSGNHVVDVISVTVVILVVLMFKKLYFK
tara:strand:- start:1451 stop:1600 length:150 start_codon:yes stop_codon:yes gene_type:complete